jgi:phosphohistidine phosphatase
LTEKGWRQAEAVGKILAKLELAPDIVLTSPLTRARETAAGLMKSAGVSGDAVIQDWLGFGLRPQVVLEELAAFPNELSRVVLVGHEPTFSGFAGWLLGAETGYAEVKKASIVHFQLSPPSRHGAELKMLLPVKVLLASS